MDELLDVRDYLNEGGRVLFTGKYAGTQYTPALGTQLYDPIAERAVPRRPGGDRRAAWRCPAPATAQNDVLEYWFGAFILNDGAGIDPTPATPFDVVRHRQSAQPA